MDLPGIKHFGFVQPEQMKKFISETGVFILPSSFEPWGVAVHEFACAGFPLILSDKVGAGEVFMVENENGFSFDCKNGNELAEAMKGMMRMSDEQLNVMSEKSARLGMKINLDTWADTVYELMQKR
jgi:glycosyltransferase involved in cell wall biosynthesis